MAKTYAQMTALIADWLGRSDLTTVIPDFLNMAIHNLERKYNWKFMRTRNTVSLVSGDYLFNNPLKRYKTLFAAVCIDQYGTRQPITKVAQETLSAGYDDFTNNIGQPSIFAQYDMPDTAALAIGTSSDLDVGFAAASFVGTDGVVHSYVAQEVTPASGTVPSNHWGVWRFCVNNAGSITSVAGAANGTTGYDTEALALAALPAVPADYIDVGYMTTLTKSGSAFVPGTDSLQGGAQGNVATTTNYYVSDAAAVEKMIVRPTADAAYTLDFSGYQYSPDLDGVVYTSNWWLANAWEIALYAALLEAEPYMINDARMATWRAKLYGDGNETIPHGALGELLKTERDEEYGEGFLVIGQGDRTSTLKDTSAYVYSFGR